ncbi:MAG TPA: hypothetical protein VFJ14_02520, partial [Nocardioidaceae bacterium]|nr:hypothetical protein [Nocardioidaceae bacterium]
MAMSGVRSLTANVGLLEQTPPERILEDQAPELMRRLDSGQRAAAAEVAHWAYGAGGGLIFGLLPARVRAHPLTGPSYGVAIWLSFELGIAPLLGIEYDERRVTSRLTLVADHVLYGIVVSGRLAPEPEMLERGR